MSRLFYREAARLEQNAALGYRNFANASPGTSAILLRSAATLYSEAGDWRDAERLIGLALSDDLPSDIAEELRDLYENVTFQRHLETRNIELSPSEIQLSLSGEGVSFGTVQSEDFLERGDALQDIIYRVAEQESGLPYRTGGSVAASVRTNFAVFLSAPRGGSFAVTYRLGETEAQTSLPLKEYPHAETVLQTVLEGLRLFEISEQAVAEKLTGKYAEEFVRQARRLAPDGKRIKQVGLTTLRDGQPQTLTLRRPIVRSLYKRRADGQVWQGRLIEIRERESGTVAATLQTLADKRLTAVSKDAAIIAQLRQWFQQNVQITTRKQNNTNLIESVTVAAE